MQSLILRVAEIRAAVKPELVHINSLGATGFFYERTASVAPSPALVTFHGDTALPVHRRPGDTLLGRMSNAMLQDVVSFVPEAATRSHVIYGSLPIPSAEPLPLPFETLSCSVSVAL